MSWRSHLKIPKRLKPLTLWIHPEGRVGASLFLDLQGKHGGEEEELLDILNQRAPFLVLKREDSHELRFYNKAFIIRAEYHEESPSQPMGIALLPCRLHLSDGSIIEGSVREALRPESSRLFDFLNLNDRAFAKIHIEQGNVCLVNKAYVVSVTPLSNHNGADPDRHSSTRETLTDLA